jgi:transcriptional regulator with XRE-family HTH domain
LLVNQKKLDKATHELVAVIGSNIRTARKEQGITQEKLAEDADISAKHLSAVENGRETNLSFRYVKGIAMALGIDYKNLLP